MIIAHLSDLHLGFSAAGDALVEERLRELCEISPDHLVISGDLSQKGQLSEFAAVVNLLRQNGFSSADKLTVIPGNHDLFSFFFKDFQAGSDLYNKLHKVPRTALNLYNYAWADYEADLALFHAAFGEYYKGILELDDTAGTGYPFIKLLGEQVALIVLDSNRFLPQIRANSVCSNGFVDLKSAQAILAHPRLENRLKIVVIHHHLLPESLVAQRAGKWYAAMTKIVNRAELVRLLDQFQVDLVLHGHYHHHEEYKIGHDIPVLNSGDFERWHLIRLDDGVLTISSRG